MASSPACISFPTIRPDDIARKVLRMNLSDLAAKGAKPIGFLLSIALPAAFDETWIAAFAAGLGDDAAHYGCPLLGGDTDHTPGPLSVSIAAFGTVPHGAMVRRSTAKAGDSIVVTGTIGDAALGVLLRRDERLASAWGLIGRHDGAISNGAICCRSRAMRSPKRCWIMPRRPWTCPTAWPATLPNCAAPPASRRKSTSPACRSRTRRARRSRPIRRCARRR